MGLFDRFFGGSKPTRPKSASKPTPKPATPPAKAKDAPSAAGKKRVNLARRFTILGETGQQGSMSKVSKAIDNESGRSVCLKVQDKAKAGAAASRADQATRPSEGAIGQEINHPRVVKVHEFGATTKGESYLVMEFIDGVSLTYTRQSRALKLAEKVGLLIQAAEALGAVHSAGFIHRDFGPQNLLVDREDRVKLIDFGLAVPNTAAFRRPGNRTGTLQYMAPELIRREPTDERIDIFSWGVTAFEFLSGKLPYDATEPMAMMRQRMNHDPMRLDAAAGHLPAGLCEVVQKALARKREDRWSSMGEVVAALRELPEARP